MLSFVENGTVRGVPSLVANGRAHQPAHMIAYTYLRTWVTDSYPPRTRTSTDGTKIRSAAITPGGSVSWDSLV